jgi:ribosomal protein RSM22 (predicted rRNA methylase)
MELPPALRRAVDGAIEGVGLDALSRAAETLSSRYRAEVRDGRWHVADDLTALAYAAARLPATYAAIRDGLEAVAAAVPEFAPRTALDVGAGPGSAIWAAAERWPTLVEAVLVEASPAMRRLGETLAGDGLRVRATWQAEDAAGGMPAIVPAELVTLAYVLDELSAEQGGGLIDRLWALTTGVLVIVEPGTSAGWVRILAARRQLIAAGAQVLAPCPHAAACPLRAPDWCHFSRRVARSKIHRLTKGAEVPWEDEKYIYVAAGRIPGQTPPSRVLAPARSASGRVWLKLCREDGSAAETLITKREGDRFKAARRAGWGDAFPATARL